MASKIEISDFDLVWAKQRYSIYWPARIIETPPEMGRTPKNQICVFFFGSKQFGFVERRNVENYKLHRDKFVKKGQKNVNFRSAVAQMDDFISDPQKNRSNAFARVIKIKQEKDIERSLSIKVEASDTLGNGRNQEADDSKSKIEALMHEKNGLIASIVSLKSENQQMCFQLSEKNAVLVAIKMQYDQKICQLNDEILELKIAAAEVANLKKDFAERKNSEKKIIADLIAEKNILTARMKQLQSGAFLNCSLNVSKQSDDEGEYEVDMLVADMLVGKTRYYQVRWKGYGPEDDTLEKEENLFCPSILEEYLKSQSKQK